MQLDRDSKVPLHKQLKENIRLSIETGEWKRGQKITSEPELTQKLGIARGTVRNAIAELIREGLLESRQGDGTYVTSRRVEQDLMGFYSFARSAREQGLEPVSQILEWSKAAASEGLARILSLPTGDIVLRVVRLRILADEPILIETCYFPEQIASCLNEEDFTHGALYDALEQRCGVNILRADETFEAIVLGEYEANLLGVPPVSPAFSVERVAYAAGKRPVELRYGIIRGDRCRYHIELR